MTEGSPVERERHRLSLSARLVLAGSLAALLPFALALLVIALTPRSTIDRVAGSALDTRLAVVESRLADDREAVRARLTDVDDADIAQAARTSNTTDLEAALETSEVGVDVDVRPANADRGGDALTAGYVTVGDDTLVVALAPSDDRLRELGEGFDIDLAIVRDGRSVASAGIAPDEIDDDGESGDDEIFTRARALSADGETLLVGARRGDRVSVLMWAQGRQLCLVLASLLATGVCTAFACASMFNRRLTQFADRAVQMAGGDYGGKLPVEGNDAAARVAESLNVLADDVDRSLAEMRRSFDRLDRTVAATEDGVCLWSGDDRIELWNSAAARLTGVSADGDPVDSATARFLREHREPGVSRTLLPVDGGDRQIVVDLTVSTTRDGGTLQVFRDSSRVIALDQARSNFLVTAAHELRTPLTPLVGFLPLLLEEWTDGAPRLEPETRELVVTGIRDSMLRLEQVVGSIFDSSMLGEQQISVSTSTNRLFDLVEAGRLAAAYTGEVVHQFDRSLSVVCDPALFTTVLAELFDNAAKYGDAPVIVGASHPVGEGACLIAFADSGDGLSREARVHGFEPFFRDDPEMRAVHGGVGLGLFRARRLVEAMGGTIEFGDPLDVAHDTPRDSRQGSGCVVLVVLPEIVPLHGA